MDCKSPFLGVFISLSLSLFIFWYLFIKLEQLWLSTLPFQTAKMTRSGTGSGRFDYHVFCPILPIFSQNCSIKHETLIETNQFRIPSKWRKVVKDGEK
jgi:hypothetical protein